MSDHTEWKCHENFAKFENDLVRFFIELGNAKWHAEKLNTIAAYIYIYGNLTQKKIGILTKFALSTISTSINVLMATGLKKRRVLGTNKHEYYFGNDVNKILEESRENTKREIFELYYFLSQKLKQLNALSEKDNKDLKQIIERITQFRKFPEIYGEIFQLTDNFLPQKDKKIKGKKETNDGDPPIKTSTEDIKQQVIDFLMQWSLLERTGAPSTRVLSLFIFNPSLNQKEIQERSNLSIAKVYKELNALCEMGLISKSRNKETNEVDYTMERVDAALIGYIAHNSEKLMRWLPKFKETEKYLRKNKANLQELNGYVQILEWTTFFLSMTRLYKGVYEFLINKLKELG